MYSYALALMITSVGFGKTSEIRLQNGPRTGSVLKAKQNEGCSMSNLIGQTKLLLLGNKELNS